MNIIGMTLVVCLALVPEEKPAPKLPVGRDTTVVMGPLDKEGYIDYEAAINERLKKGVTPESNANVLLVRAFGPRPEGANMPAEYFKHLGIEEPPEKGNYLISLEQFLKDLKLNQDQIDIANKQLERARQRPWAGDAFPHVNAWLIISEKPLALVIEATKRPAYFNPLTSRRAEGAPSALISVLLPTVQKSRGLATLLTTRAMMRIHEGKFDEAWHDLLACHRLARHVAHGAFLIEFFVGVAIDQIATNADLVYLEHAKLTAAQVRDRLKDLQALPPFPPLADTIDLGERFMCLDCLQMVRRSGVNGLELLAGGFAPANPDPKWQPLLDSLDWTPAYRNTNRWFDRLTAATRLPIRAEREAQFDKIEQDLKALKMNAGEPEKLAKLLRAGAAPDKALSKTIGDFVIVLLMPATRKLQNASDRIQQVRQNLHVAFALAAFRLDNGRYPARLDDLAPKYLSAVPGDQFSGKDLIYRPTEAGYLFYSVGVNGKDEEGRYLDDDPPGDDLKVRMPLAELKP